MSEGRVRLRAGTLYGALERLESQGYVAFDGEGSAGGPRHAVTTGSPRPGSSSRRRGLTVGRERAPRIFAPSGRAVMTTHERVIRWLTDRMATDAPYRREVGLTVGELCRGAGLVRAVAGADRPRRSGAAGARPQLRPARRRVARGRVPGRRPAVDFARGRERRGRRGHGGELRPRFDAHRLDGVLASRQAVIVAALGFAAGSAVVGAVWVYHGVEAGAFLSACVVAIGGLLAGGHQLARPRYAMRAGAGHRGRRLVGIASRRVRPTRRACSVGVDRPATLLLAGGSTAIGGVDHDDRSARLAASGFGELGRALAVLQEHGQRQLLLRWLAMGATVVAAWAVTHRSIRRTARL